jgi:hypothetical protein
LSEVTTFFSPFVVRVLQGMRPQNMLLTLGCGAGKLSPEDAAVLCDAVSVWRALIRFEIRVTESLLLSMLLA